MSNSLPGKGLEVANDGATNVANPGAPAAAGFVPLCVPHIVGNAWDYVRDCLDTNWVSSGGAYVDRFEQAVAARAGARHGVAIVNGTAALHTALMVTGVQPDDEVLVPSLTFIASANAIRHTGAFPVWIDSEPDYWQIDPEAVRAFLHEECEQRDDGTFNRATGRRVAAVMVVHVLGHAVDADPIVQLAHEFGLAVIEDAAESLGARYRGRPVGSLGDAAVFSSNGNKLLTTGGGGVLALHDDAIAERARYLTTTAKDDPVEYVHGEVGWNYRLTNLQAALGCAQMEQLDTFLAAKRRIAERYREAFAGVPGLATMPEAPWCEATYWLYTIRVGDRFGCSSRELLKWLGDRRIQSRPLWQPLHRSPAFDVEGVARRDCPVADAIARTALSLPSSVGLTEADQDRVIDAVHEAAVASRRAIPA
jgi:perosamine synthetase